MFASCMPSSLVYKPLLLLKAARNKEVQKAVKDGKIDPLDKTAISSFRRSLPKVKNIKFSAEL